MSILDESTTQNMRSDTGLHVTNEMKRNWITISKWALFLAILGFIYIGLSLLMIGSMSTVLQMMAAMTDNPVLEAMGPLMSYLTVFTLLMLAVMFFIHYYHLRFSTNIQRAVNFTDQTAFEKAWLNLRNHFRLYGIVVCAIIVLYVILLVVVGSLMANATIPVE